MRLRRQRIIAWVAGALGIVLLAAGLLVPNTMLWRAQLLTGLWLLSLPLRTILYPARTTTSRSLARLGIVLGLGFAAISLQLVRDQIIFAEQIRTRVSAIFQPEPSQPEDSSADLRPTDRESLGSGHTWPVTVTLPLRGTITDRNGLVLASTQDGRRVYPEADLGYLVGYASRLYGTAGVEAHFDPELSGAASLNPTAPLAARLLGTPINLVAADIRLTLDANLQRAAQAALGQQPGAVVVLDPQTGAILAIAGYPYFNPNDLVLPDQATPEQVAQVQAAWQSLNERPDSPLINRATQGRYPPGSVIKTLTAAAALDSGVLSGPDGQVTCPERLTTEPSAPPVINSVPGLSAWTGNPSDLRRVFAFSCNTAFAQLGLALGAERFTDYAARFGLGLADAPLTPELTDTAADAGTIAGDASFLSRPVALADTAFGQGQALVTPLDMARLVATIGSDGRVMRPYLVQEVRRGDQVVYSAQPTELRQAISPTAAQQMRDIMRVSVEIGYAAPVALPGLAIGAKTGTAETPSGAPHAWFMALAPLDQPSIAIAVIVENGGEGSRTALPVARQVLAAAFGIQQ